MHINLNWQSKNAINWACLFFSLFHFYICGGSRQGPCHTKHFCTRYCDIAIKDIFIFDNFETKVSMSNQGKLLKIFIMYVVLCFVWSLSWPKDIHGPKIFFIATFYKKISCVTWPLGPCHTQYFCTQYWDKKILQKKINRHFLSKYGSCISKYFQTTGIDNDFLHNLQYP